MTDPEGGLDASLNVSLLSRFAALQQPSNGTPERVGVILFTPDGKVQFEECLTDGASQYSSPPHCGGDRQCFSVKQIPSSGRKTGGDGGGGGGVVVGEWHTHPASTRQGWISPPSCDDLYQLLIAYVFKGSHNLSVVYAAEGVYRFSVIRSSKAIIRCFRNETARFAKVNAASSSSAAVLHRTITKRCFQPIITRRNRRHFPYLYRLSHAPKRLWLRLIKKKVPLTKKVQTYIDYIRKDFGIQIQFLSPQINNNNP
jgi:hypothetical protein